MSAYHLRKFVVCLLFILLFISACGGQEEPQPVESENNEAEVSETAVSNTADSAETDPAEAETTEEVVTEAELTTVKVVSLPFISFAPIYIALEEGYFEEQGLAIEIVSFTQQQDTLPALISGEVDVIGGLVSIAYLNAMARGGDIKFVSDKGYIDPEGCSNFAVVMAKGVAEANDPTDPETLRGQVVNIQEATWLTYFLEKELNTIGLTLADIEQTSIPSPGQPEAMNQGTIAATTQNEPWVTILASQGHQVILEPVQDLLPESQSAVLLYGPSLLNDNPEVGDRFMAAYLKAVATYNEGKTERNIEILAQSLSLEPELLQNMCWPTLRADGSLDVPSILDFQEWAITNGFLDTAVTEDQFWDGRFIENGAALLEASN